MYGSCSKLLRTSSLPVVQKKSRYTTQSTRLLLDRSLVIVQVARVRVLQAVLGHERRGRDAVGDEVFAEVEDALRHLRRALAARRGVAVARPHELRQRGRARPHLARDDGVVDLLGPERGDGAEDVLGLGLGEVEREVVVVDTLPGLVRGAPGAAVAAVVEVGGVGVRVGHDVVARVVGDEAAVAAVEVEEVGRRHDDVVPAGGQVLDVGQPAVPRL